jgi:cysteine desulfuration protein SufE
MSTPQRLSEILDTLDLVSDQDERSALLIDFSDRFREVPRSVAQRPFPEDHRVRYCESEAYVWAVEQPDGTLKFYFAVENPSGISAKALAVLLDRALSGAPLEDVASVSSDIVQSIFRQNISMGKGMGLMSMVETVRNLARHQLSKRSS